MTSRLRPIDLEVSLLERTYGLGKTIDLTIELMPHRDCHVREGRVDLMLEERWTERSSVTIEIPIKQKSSSAAGSWSNQVGTTTETRDVVTDHEGTSAHSSVVFLEDPRLVSGRDVEYRVRLEVRPEPPARTGEAETKWWLQTVIDVAGARDIKPRSKVSIVV